MSRIEAPWEERLDSAERTGQRWLEELQQKRERMDWRPLICTLDLQRYGGTLEQLQLVLAQRDLRLDCVELSQGGRRLKVAVQ